MRENNLCQVVECEMQTNGGKIEFGWNIIIRSGPKRLDIKAGLWPYNNLAKVKILQRLKQSNDMVHFNFIKVTG